MFGSTSPVFTRAVNVSSGDGRAFHPDAAILIEEARWLTEAAKLRLVTSEALVAWADFWITALDAPPYWLIEVSTAQSKDPAQYVGHLRQASRSDLRASQCLSLVIAFYERQRIDLNAALAKAFAIWLEAARIAPDDAPDPDDHALLEKGPLPDLLVEWDCRRNVEPLSPDFESRCHIAFREHVARHGAAPCLSIFSN